MHHKIKSVLMILLLVGIMVILSLFIGSGGITGSTVVNTIACYQHSDCDDRLEKTEDLCRNPGTKYSLCVNKIKE